MVQEGLCRNFTFVRACFARFGVFLAGFLAAMVYSPRNSQSLVAQYLRINLSSPEVNPARHRARARDPLRAQPGCGIHASHTMVTKEYDFVRRFQARQVGRNFAKRDQHRTFDVRRVIFPLLANVDEEDFLAAGKLIFHLAGSNFHICVEVFRHESPNSTESLFLIREAPLSWRPPNPCSLWALPTSARCPV